MNERDARRRMNEIVASLAQPAESGPEWETRRAALWYEHDRLWRWLIDQKKKKNQNRRTNP